jgi:hypothetical protein
MNNKEEVVDFMLEISNNLDISKKAELLSLSNAVN